MIVGIHKPNTYQTGEVKSFYQKKPIAFVAVKITPTISSFFIIQSPKLNITIIIKTLNGLFSQMVCGEYGLVKKVPNDINRY